MTFHLSHEQSMYCFPGSNASCVVKQYTFGINFSLYLVFLFGTLVTILGNSLVILSICHFKQLHSPTNVLILSLALVDLLVGVIVMPFSATRTVHGCWFYGDMFCHIHASFEVFLPTLSIFHLICIAVDRHQAICNPLHYSRKITMSVAMIMVCLSWALTAVYAYGVIYSKANVAGLEDIMELFCLGGCFVYFNPLWGMLSSALCFFFPCTVMVCLYTKIFIVAEQHVRKIGDMNNNSSNDRGRGGLIKQSESKAAKTLSIVLGVFIFCWMPFFMQFIIDPLTGHHIDPFLLEALYWLSYFNSACNPIIYALFYPSFKKCFHSIITLKIFSPNSSTMNLSVK